MLCTHVILSFQLDYITKTKNYFFCLILTIAVSPFCRSRESGLSVNSIKTGIPLFSWAFTVLMLPLKWRSGYFIIKISTGVPFFTLSAWAGEKYAATSLWDEFIFAMMPSLVILSPFFRLLRTTNPSIGAYILTICGGTSLTCSDWAAAVFFIFLFHKNLKIFFKFVSFILSLL